MQKVTETSRVQSAPDHQFGFGVLTTNSRHHAAAGLLVDNVRHSLLRISEGAAARPQDNQLSTVRHQVVATW